MSAEDLAREAGDPATSAGRLAELAQADPATWPLVAAHPNAYEGLLDWLGTHGDDSVRAAITARPVASAPATPPPPPPPPPAGGLPTSPPPTAAPSSAPPAESPTAPLPVTPAPTPLPQGMPAGPPQWTPEAGVTEAPTGSGSRRRLALIAGGVVAAVLLGAGGFFGAQAIMGDDDDSTPESAAATTPSESSEPSSTPSSVPSEEESSGSAEDDGGFCATFKQQQDESLDLLSSQDGGMDLDKLKEQMEALSKRYDALASDGPEDVRADLRTMADYFEAVSSASTGSGDAEDIQGRLQKFTEASQNVAQYYYKNCS